MSITKKTLAALLVLVSTPAHASLWASPGFVNFWSVEVGGYAPTEYVTVRNSGPDAVDGISVSSTCMNDFSVSSIGCSGRLQPNSSCSITIRFQPWRPGDFACSVQISSFSGGGSTSVSVRGQATERRFDESSDGVSENLTPENPLQETP